MMGLHVVLAVSDFPLWIRVTHYVNLLFMFLLMRAGLQILMAHPRLYWNSSCKPGSAWLTFTKATVPTDRLYTAMDDERSISPSGSVNCRCRGGWSADGRVKGVTPTRLSAGDHPLCRIRPCRPFLPT